MGFLSGSDGKESACNAGDPGSIPGSGRSLEKEMATHSSILAWRIPWTEEAGRLQSMDHKESDMTERLSLHFTFTRVRQVSSRKSCEECRRIPKKRLYSQNPGTHAPNAHRCHHQAPSSNPERPPQPFPEQTHLSKATWNELMASWQWQFMQWPSDKVCVSGTVRETWLEQLRHFVHNFEKGIPLFKVKQVGLYTHTRTFYCFKSLGVSSHFFTMYILNSYVSRYNKYNLLTLK